MSSSPVTQIKERKGLRTGRFPSFLDGEAEPSGRTQPPGTSELTRVPSGHTSIWAPVRGGEQESRGTSSRVGDAPTGQDHLMTLLVLVEGIRGHMRLGVKDATGTQWTFWIEEGQLLPLVQLGVEVHRFRTSSGLPATGASQGDVAEAMVSFVSELLERWPEQEDWELEKDASGCAQTSDRVRPTDLLLASRRAALPAEVLQRLREAGHGFLAGSDHVCYFGEQTGISNGGYRVLFAAKTTKLSLADVFALDGWLSSLGQRGCFLEPDANASAHGALCVTEGGVWHVAYGGDGLGRLSHETLTSMGRLAGALQRTASQGGS